MRSKEPLRFLFVKVIGDVCSPIYFLTAVAAATGASHGFTPDARDNILCDDVLPAAQNEELKEDVAASILRTCYRWSEDPGLQMYASTLRQYASRSCQIVELGTRTGASTWALLQGLHDVSDRACAKLDRKALRAYDSRYFPLEQKVQLVASRLGIEYSFGQADVLNVQLEETDLVFIDTFHVYAQLRAELQRHSKSVRVGGHILLHDTTVFGDVSECFISGGVDVIRNVHCNQNRKSLGVRYVEVLAGIWGAVEEFLSAHSQWRLVERQHHTPGLAVLGYGHGADSQLSTRGRTSMICAWWHAHQPYSHYLDIPSPVKSMLVAEYEHLQAMVQLRRTSWAHAQLGIFLLAYASQLPTLATDHQHSLKHEFQHLKRQKTNRKHDVNVSAVAFHHIDQALWLNPLQPHALLARAQRLQPNWASQQCGPNPLRCLQLLKNAVKAHGTWESRLVLGSVLAACGGPVEEAQTMLTTALWERPRSHLAAQLAGRFLWRQGHRDSWLRRLVSDTDANASAEIIPLTIDYWRLVLCRIPYT